MSLDQKVSALTAALRSEFWKGWQETAAPAPYESFTTVVPSTTKIENYVNFTPVPGMTQWAGHRNYGRVDSLIYSIRNLTYQNGIVAGLEDIEDDQTGGLMLKPKELVVRAKMFPGRAVLKALAPAQSTVNNGFDGTPFINGSHTFGSGNNSLTFATADSLTSSSTHATIYNLFALYYGDPVMKPLLWQNRSGPDFETNAGSTQSKESRQVRWWCDLRGAAAYGWWWNAVYVQITGLPNIAEMHSIYQSIEAQFRTFQLPKTISTEDGEYIHEQSEFSAGNLYLAGSTYLAELFRQSLNQDWVPQNVGVGASTTNTVATTNLWKGWAKYVVSVFLN